MLPILAVALLLVLPAAPVAPSVAVASIEPTSPFSTSNWTVEPVDFFGGSSEPGIALDTHGAPRILYCPPGDVRYASRDLRWSYEHIVFTPFGGVCGELAMGPGDVPHVTTPWATAYGGELYGTRAANGTWDLAVYPGGVLGAVNSRGEPQVVTYWTPAPGRFSFRYLTLANGTWVHEDVETFPATGGFGSAWASLALDTRDQPHVLYYDDLRGDVRYAFRTETGWHVKVVDHIGTLNMFGRNGSLALGSDGTPYAVYTVRLSGTNAEVRYAVPSGGGWAVEVVSEPPPALGGRGQSPTVAVAPSGPVVLYRREWWLAADASSLDEDLLYAVRTPSGWVRDVVYDGRFLLNDPANRTDDVWDFAQFPTMVLDRCGNPHAAFYMNHYLDGVQESGVYYATKGGPCDIRTVRLDLDPHTLNLKSHGKWVTASVEAENASAADLDRSSLRLNGVAAAWTRVLGLDGTLIAKFDRQAFAATVQPGESVVVTLTGRWKDGGAFTATDTIRVIQPGR